MARAQRGEAAVNTTAESLDVRAKRLIDEVLKPLFAADRSTIELVSVSADRLVVHLAGASAGCPGTPFALKGIIEPAARKALGATIRVELD